MPHQIIYREKYGQTGHSSVFVKNSKGDSTLVQLSSGLESPPKRNLYSLCTNFFTQVFLPQGYPESVRDDYCSYQIWDTLQAFCSTISGILTTHAIMKSVGVGDAAATALSATITWVLKDGIGMIGRIMFAWWKGHALDTDSKKWRLFADLVNDAAMFLELLLLPLFPEFPTHVLCLTTSMKGLVGVAGGAARASITQHHAIRNNNGDVSAKDGSQETCVNLVASTVGMAALTYTESNNLLVWALFTLVTLVHIFANYKAVKSLNLVTFNAERLNRYLFRHLNSDDSYSPKEVNKWESVFVGFSYTDKKLCGFSIKYGYSIQKLVKEKKVTSQELVIFSDMFKEKLYLLLPHLDSSAIYVLLHPSASAVDVIQAHYHCVLVGLTMSAARGATLDVFCQANKGKIINYLVKEVEKLRNISSKYSISNLESLTITGSVVDKEFFKFIDGVRNQGWNLDIHSLEVDEWRGEWTDSDLKETFKNK